jgi:acetoin utilization deacetylase AcuC-like enzyme
MTGVYYHELFGKHLEGYPHVESPERYRTVMERLRGCPFIDKLEFIEAAPAKKEWITAVHEESYFETIMSMKIDGYAVLDMGDTVATAATQEAALHSAGAGVQAVDDVLSGRLESAFCAGRPPGHHAERGRAMGFCIFNNIAVAASWLLSEGGLERVAVIDWDVHHGNGTERIFLEDPRVLYVSLHQYPHYPGTGQGEMVGMGKGTGYTLNIPMISGSDDDSYRDAFNSRILPAIDKFAPQFILISAGFDAHAGDPLSGAVLSTGMFGEMTGMLVESAGRNCGGRIVSLMEGGYDLGALADSVEAHVAALVDG